MANNKVTEIRRMSGRVVFWRDSRFHRTHRTYALINERKERRIEQMAEGLVATGGARFDNLDQPDNFRLHVTKNIQQA